MESKVSRVFIAQQNGPCLLVKAENLVLNDSSERQVVEQLSENFPHISISILSQALVVEAISIQKNTQF